MDRNSVIGLLLIAAILIIYSIYQQPSTEELQRQAAINDSIAAAQAQKAIPEELENTASVDTLQPAADGINEDDSLYQAVINKELEKEFGLLAPVARGEEKSFSVTTEKFIAEFSTKGGSINKVVLTEYTTYDSLPLVLFNDSLSKFGVAFTYPGLGNLNTADLYFSTNTGDISLEGEETAQVIMTLPVTDGKELQYIYTFTGNKYDLGLELRVEGMEGLMQNPKLVWEMSGFHNEKSLQTERDRSSIFYKEVDTGRDYLSETGEDEAIVDEQGLEWIAFKQNFFSAILIGEKPFEKNAKLVSYGYESEEDESEASGSGRELTQYYYAELPLPTSGSTVMPMKMFFGPNDYKVLKHYGNEIDRIINLGWGIFGWVNKYVVILIFDWLEDTGMSYGIIILILTLIIKIVLSPLTFKNYLSSARMKVLKPEIEELNEKHKNADAMKKQQATMELYRKTGVNPMAGCLPMLIQLPILYAMFQFFPSSIQLRHEGFLWADDLSAYDSIASLPFHIPFYGDHVSLFTLLMAASTMIYTIYNSNMMPTQTQPGMPNMKVMMYIFPFMMIFFFNSYSSGLSYYYFLANLISIIQMLVIKKLFIDEEKIKAKIEENKKRPGVKGKSKFQQRLEQMAKQKGYNQK